MALTAGAMCLLGWLTGNERLKAVFAGGIAMKANAAISLCLTALALLLLVPERRPALRTALGRGCAIAAGVLGLVTLFEHLTGWDLHIDQLLFPEPPGQLATASPGRMGPPASLCFALLGSGLWAIDVRTRRNRAPSQWLAVLVGIIALLPTIGYVIGARQLYGIAAYTGVAVHMAVALLALALGLFLMRPGAEPAATLMADNSGGQLARSLLPATIVLPVAIGWLRTLGEQHGIYDTLFGRALLLLAFVLMFSTLVWRLAVRFSGMATARALAEQETSRATAEAARLLDENTATLGLLDSLLAHAPIGLAFFDAGRACVRVNDFLSRVTGEPGESFLGKDVLEVLPGHGADLERTLSALFARGEPAADVELVQRSGPDELGRSWLCGLFPVRDARGGSTLFGVVLVEITERKRLEEQRAALLDSERAARAEAERAAQLKDQFLATVSHELRTPLNAISGWVAVAKRNRELPPSLVRPLEIIERNAALQAQLIEDLLDVSRIVSGKLRLELESVDLRSLMQAAVADVTPAMQAKELRLHTELASEHARIVADPARLSQIVANLLTNALKFTPKGGEVWLRLREEADELEISVSDTGVGIRPEFLPHVFDFFRQADASTTRGYGGLGLGLAITRDLVELHGGSLRVASEGEGRGSTFTVRLPITGAQEPAAPALPSAPTPDASALQDASILVVDDDADAREFLGDLLAEHAARVRVVASADEALDAIAASPPGLLISDIGMPLKDGYDLIRAVRSRYSADVLPAIALTAFARAEDRARALAAGFQRHLAKPVDPAALVRCVADLLRQHDTVLDSVEAR